MKSYTLWSTTSSLSILAFLVTGLCEAIWTIKQINGNLTHGRGSSFNWPSSALGRHIMKKLEHTEMLYNQGKSALTDSQIIAAITNIPVDKARQILVQADHKLSELARWDMES